MLQVSPRSLLVVFLCYYLENANAVWKMQVGIEKNGVIRSMAVDQHNEMSSVVTESSDSDGSMLATGQSANLSASALLGGRKTVILQCLVAFNSGDVPPDEECPAECPYVGETETPCQFKCVGAHQCASANRETTIADPDDLICRSCSVEACEECLHSGKDECKACSQGYTLLDDGTCEAPTLFGKGFIVMFVFVGLFFLSALFYLIDLIRRPVLNEELMQRGFRQRWRSRLFNYEAGTGAPTQNTQDGLGDTGGEPLATSEPQRNPRRSERNPGTDGSTGTHATAPVDDDFTPLDSKLWP
jgi:hypothetical protein